MKIKFILLGLVIIGFIIIAFKSISSGIFLVGAFTDHPSCRIIRKQLDEARYWLALDNGMTNAPGLDTNALAVYVRSDRLRCPDGGVYSINMVSLKVTCSIPNHMAGNHKGSSSLSPLNWADMFPLNYRSSDKWWLSLRQDGDNAVLRLSGATVIFQGLNNCGIRDEEIPISGASFLHDEGPDKYPRISYSFGVFKMTLPGHILQVTDAGRILKVDHDIFDLSTNRPIITINKASNVNP